MCRTHVVVDTISTRSSPKSVEFEQGVRDGTRADIADASKEGKDGEDDLRGGGIVL